MGMVIGILIGFSVAIKSETMRKLNKQASNNKKRK